MLTDTAVWCRAVKEYGLRRVDGDVEVGKLVKGQYTQKRPHILGLQTSSVLLTYCVPDQKPSLSFPVSSYGTHAEPNSALATEWSGG